MNTYRRLAASFALATALAVGIGLAVRHVAPASATPALPGLVAPAPAGLASLADGTVSDVAERVVESVVNISSSHAVAMGPAAMDPWFTDPRSPFYAGPGEPSDRQQTSMGSGVIVTAQGRILTNAHVVAGAETIRVTLHDGTELEARVVGTDPRSDLAVLQLQGDVPTLKALPIGDSKALRLGEVVLAVGNPFGVGQAVTMGIVSAQGRAAVGIVDYEDFIQTDAAINPGNSGGALVNMRGELIGINTAILSRSGGYQGIGFAIPTAMAKPIADMLVRDGKVVRGYLGVGIASIDKKLAEQHKLSTLHGVLLSEVEPQSPAARAGLKVGDVVVALDGAPVKDAARLRNTIAMAGADKPITLAVLRGKTRVEVKATTGALPDQNRQQRRTRTQRRTP